MLGCIDCAPRRNVSSEARNAGGDVETSIAAQRSSSERNAAATSLETDVRSSANVLIVHGLGESTVSSRSSGREPAERGMDECAQRVHADQTVHDRGPEAYLRGAPLRALVERQAPGSRERRQPVAEVVRGGEHA